MRFNMRIKDQIENTFQENSIYAQPMQAVNQASSLNVLSSDLYTDSKRFIYELLQNADDSCKNDKTVKVWIKIFGDNLVIAHSGSPFTKRDVQGICNINNGTKKTDISKTGYKGIGFKSVFGQSDKVTIYTEDEYFSFDANYQFEWAWEDTKEHWETNNDREFQFPWQIIPIYTESKDISKSIDQFVKDDEVKVATIIHMKNIHETSEAIQSLANNLNVFLFLKNICEINFDLEEKNSIKIDRSVENRISLQKNNEAPIDWLINTMQLKVPRNVKYEMQDERNVPDKLIKTEVIELSLAAKIEADGIVKLSNHEKLLYSYLPTDETKYSLPVLANTSFLTSANRESLHTDSKWNQWLFKTIAVEIFRWISILVLSEFKSEAYKLIPNKIVENDLGKAFNEGINEALKSVPFILSKQNELIKIENTIVDFTSLSDKKFIEKDSIKFFTISRGNTVLSVQDKQFAKNKQFFYDFKKMGAICFEWNDLKSFLSSKKFIETHTISDNIDLIKYIKIVCSSGKNMVITESFCSELPFIWDQKNVLNYPNRVCFPVAGDDNWNNPNNELSFVHQELQNWLVNDMDSRQWLGKIGITERTDTTYIAQNILPNANSYITKDNAIQTIRELFGLYMKGELKKDLIIQLADLKLLTLNDTLCPAKMCYLSNYYNPRLKSEKILEKNIFVSSSYCQNPLYKDEWKIFFKILGVQEGISKIKYVNKSSTSSLVDSGIKNEYFESEDKYFKPYVTIFKADTFSEVITMNYINFIENNYEFSLEFWNDYIENFDNESLEIPARAYWGNEGRPGRRNGDPVENYVPWLINNTKIIPTLLKKCEISSKVLLNTKEIKELSGKYLPVFSGPELNSDWRSFFNFKTTLNVADYLEILKQISLDTDKNNYLKSENYERIQSVYSKLLIQCINWNTDDIETVKAWSQTEQLLNTKRQFTKCNSLKFFLDGNENVFQEQYIFMMLSAKNKEHPNLEKFLEYFQVKLLRQSEFELIYNQLEEATSLKEKLRRILPFFGIWIASEDNDSDVVNIVNELQAKVSDLEIYQSDQFEITYTGIDFTKGVNTHYNERKLYVTYPWNSNSVFLTLSEILCKYFCLNGYGKKLDFLLRSTQDEIQEYFEQEELEIPATLYNEFDSNTLIKKHPISNFSDIERVVNETETTLEFFYMSKSDYEGLKYAERLISRSVENVLSHLEKLPEYDCSNYFKIATSIIGGIIKNGNEITVVARPSDNNQVLIYYTSEFDVLEYVDAELWYEDGTNIPQKITIGQLLKKTGVNRIPINTIELTESEIESLTNESKSEILEFSAVPYAPQKIAKIISSLANTSGGKLIFGMTEISPDLNEVVGLSKDFSVTEITKNAISLLSPIPNVVFDWAIHEDKSIFVIKTDKSGEDILLGNNKYVRVESQSVIEGKSEQITQLSVPRYTRTLAIIIAIEDYTKREINQITKVKYAINDALEFKKMLVESMNISEEDIVMITNENALKSNLENDLKYHFYNLNEEDRLIFYYVGHGFHDGITNYLSTFDMHPSNVIETAVSLKRILLEPLQKSKCNNALIFIDACAQMFQNPNERNNIKDINDEEIKLFSSEFPYYATFLSCQTGESSYSSDKLSNGIWTYHLVKALKGQVPEVLSDNKYITDISLREYLSKSVAEYTKHELGYDQNPKSILDSSYTSVISEIKN